MTEPLPAVVRDCLLGVLSEPTEQKVAANESTGATLPSIAMNNDYISGVLYKSKQSQLSPIIIYFLEIHSSPGRLETVHEELGNDDLPKGRKGLWLPSSQTSRCHKFVRSCSTLESGFRASLSGIERPK
jgi:hypothetical protein